MLQFNFMMICIIHEILVLLKITRILKRFLRRIIMFYFLLKKKIFFLQHIMMKCPNLKKENIIKDVRNIFRLENLKKKKQLIPQIKI